MASIEKFEDLKVWQEARELSREVFESILENDQIRDYSFKDQINRSSGSVMDNIAEGFGRKGNKEFRQFLTISHGSNDEAKSQLYRAWDRKYISEKQFLKLKQRCETISKMINGLVIYLNKSNLKGSKFKLEEPAEHYRYSDLEL